MSDSTFENVERLLDAERAALLSGDLGALAGIAERKESLVRELAESEPARGGLARLRAKAERNAELLTASAKGVRAVVRRVGEIRDANGPLKTYGRDGTQQTLGSAAGSLEKRA
jgi:flagellar biosynthesis/type III secretory pathway chaperone